MSDNLIIAIIKCVSQIALGALGGWVVMLGIGIVHAQVFPPLYPAGFWVGWLLFIIIDAVAQITRLRVEIEKVDV